jgi:tetratricopeptide (TPR) repeat protein
MVPFDERVEILARELELAVKWQRPCILLLVYSSEYVRSDVEAALGNYLFDLGQKSVHLRIKDRDTADVIEFLQEFKDPANAVFFIDGFRWGITDQASVYSNLNLQREFFVERQIRTIFWLTPNEIVDLAHAAPDFWAYRHRVIEFVESPKAEQVLKQALDSAWQGTPELADAYEDTDAKISLRESLLTELPLGEEAGSIRANLLLTLGVLNWRKGDFEQADAQITEALEIAGKVQDPWFEAECYNAQALIKSSTERYDEAIDAYKQAIHLAPDQIFAWNNLGNLCARIGRNDEAMIAFRKAVEGNHKDPIAWNGLANLHFRLGYVDDAIAAYRKAIQSMPTFAQPWCGLGEVYASVGRTEEAMKAFHKAIELNPKYVTPWIRLGVLFTKQERFREAIKAYQKALGLDAHNSALWNEIGTIHVRSEALDDAVKCFSTAIELNRGFGMAYSNLAFAYMQQGKYKETVSLLLRSIDLLEKDTDKAISWNRLAHVYRYLNDYDNALAAYQMGDRLDPGVAGSKAEFVGQASAAASEPIDTLPAVADAPAASAEAGAAPDDPSEDAELASTPAAQQSGIPEAPAWLFNRAEAAVDQAVAASSEVSAIEAPEIGEPAAAVQQPEPEPAAAPAVEPAENAPVAGKVDESMDAFKWTERGNGCFARGEFEDAIAAYNAAIQLDPTFGAPYSNLALTYLTGGRSAEAVLLYQKSIELLKSDKDKALSWNGLGNAYRCQDDYANAVTAYQKAAELDPETGGIRDQADDFRTDTQPDTAQTWNDRGELYFQVGSLEEAITAFNKAIELQAGAGLPYCNLAGALTAQGKYREAVPLYQKSIELFRDDKDKADAWNRLGNVYRKMNDYDLAIDAYKKAVALADEGVDLLTRTRFSLLSNVYVPQ